MHQMSCAVVEFSFWMDMSGPPNQVVSMVLLGNTGGIFNVI